MAEYTKIETAMEIICDLCKDLYPDEDCPGKCDWMEYLEENAADVAPVVHGKWLRADDFVICSQCEAEMNQKNSLGVDNFKNYCPNCGARMDGDAE